MKTPWTQQDLDYVRQAYSEGKREKVIALELGRSEASVSKAITRHGLRHKRDYNTLQERRSKRVYTPRPVQVTRILEDKTFNGRPCNWTTPDEVLRFLGEQSPNFFIKYTHGKPEFIFNNQTVSLTKVLMEANRIRIALNQPIFHLEEVTE